MSNTTLILTFISLLIINMISWYFIWKKTSQATKEWIPIILSLIVYIVTMDFVNDFKNALLEKSTLSTWIISLFLFSIYVFIAYKAYQSNRIANQDTNLT